MIRKLSWIFDYYFAYFLINDRKRDWYQQYLINKYPEKFNP